ncbi:hypothetical protein O181_040249 [Austropuccinia psidii MF-1]|uniref:Uncharacterized protein n=1 Tax=Austropuccinia psidii MF-1 TaxID=1389203 RepID=A0A9Q3DC19_9BASI|nr:hypothetical protein [Austropuccinia psidii MF-1]
MTSSCSDGPSFCSNPGSQPCSLLDTGLTNQKQSRNLFGPNCKGFVSLVSKQISQHQLDHPRPIVLAFPYCLAPFSPSQARHNLNTFQHLQLLYFPIINTTKMAPIEHINPLLFITDTLTESNTSAPNSDTPNLTSSGSAIGQRARSHMRKSGLYQTMVSDDESLEEYDIGDEDYVVAEDNGLGMDDVTPPKQA